MKRQTYKEWVASLDLLARDNRRHWYVRAMDWFAWHFHNIMMRILDALNRSRS